jgi:hypothetical protein
MELHKQRTTKGRQGEKKLKTNKRLLAAQQK